MLVCVVRLYCWTQGRPPIHKEGHVVRRHVFHSQLKTSTHGGDQPSLLGHSLCAASCLLPQGKKGTGNCGGLVPSNHDSMVGLGYCQLSYGETGLRWKINMCPTNHPSADVVLMIQLQIRGKVRSRLTRLGLSFPDEPPLLYLPRLPWQPGAGYLIHLLKNC